MLVFPIFARFFVVCSRFFVVFSSFSYCFKDVSCYGGEMIPVASFEVQMGGGSIEKHEESIRRLRDKMEEDREDVVASEQSNWREKFRSLTKKCEIRVEELRIKMEDRDERQRQRFEEEREQQNQQ